MPSSDDSTLACCRAEGMHAEELDREIFILDSNKGRIHALNTTAAALWQLIAEPATIGELADDFHSAFPETPRTKLVREITKAVESMEDKGLIRRTALAD